jgi:hypothetical protein
MEFNFHDPIVNPIIALVSETGATQTGHKVQDHKRTVRFAAGNGLMVSAVEDSSLAD